MNARSILVLGALALMGLVGWWAATPGAPEAGEPRTGAAGGGAPTDAQDRPAALAPPLDAGEPSGAAERAEVPVPPAAARRALLERFPGTGLLTVEVTGRRGGVEGALVRLSRSADPRPLDGDREPLAEGTAGRTDAEGEARFLVRALRMADLRVEVPEGTGGTYSTRVSTPAVGARKRVRVDVLAPGDAAGEVRVLEVDTGSPVVGARISAVREGLTRTIEAVTDGTGRATLGVRGGCRLAVEAEGYSSREVGIELLDEPVTVELVPHARVWGRVELPEGFGAVSLSARWDHVDSVVSFPGGASRDLGGAWNGEPGEGGAWSIEGIGFRDLRTSIHVSVVAATDRGTFSLADGIEVHAGESVEVASPLAGARFEPVRLRYPSGDEPVHGPSIELLGSGGERSALTAPDGDWNPVWLPVEPWEYEIAGVRLGPVTRAADGSAELVLHGLGRICGRVEGVAAGERPPRVRALGWTTVDCAADGTFVVDCLPLERSVPLLASSARTSRSVLLIEHGLAAGAAGVPVMPGTEDVVLTVER